MKSSLLVGAIHYTLIEEKDLCDYRPDGTRVGLNGHIRYNECQIKVDSDLHPQIKEITIWHEVLHGILENAGFFQEQTHERIIDALAHGIVQVLRDNPEMGKVGFMSETKPDEQPAT